MRLDSIVAEVSSLLAATWPAAIQFRTSIDPAASAVSIDSSQVHQALMNLCGNACHAIGTEAGRVDVRVQNHTVGILAGAGEAELPAGAYVRLSVSDTGTGMDETTLQHAFEPFFTTCGSRHGSGLGLSIVREVMRAHHGIVRVQSQLGAGTTVDLIFPAHPETPDSPPVLENPQPPEKSEDTPSHEH